MATQTVEERLAKLEEKVASLSGEQEKSGMETPWWKKIVGVYRDDPEFDEAERLGREYRKAQPNPFDNPEALEI